MYLRCADEMAENRGGCEDYGHGHGGVAWMALWTRAQVNQVHIFFAVKKGVGVGGTT